jgi:hypothetical protein
MTAMNLYRTQKKKAGMNREKIYLVIPALRLYLNGSVFHRLRSVYDDLLRGVPLSLYDHFLLPSVLGSHEHGDGGYDLVGMYVSSLYPNN